MIFRARFALIFMFMVGLSGIAPAAKSPPPDQRIAMVDYKAGQVVPLRSAIGNNLAIIFAPGEKIMSVEAEDPGAIELSGMEGSDSLFIKVLREPTSPLIGVKTDKREYNFSLKLGSPANIQYVVQFNPGKTATYKISGDKELRPSRVSDDGVHTYLEWTEEQSLPAVFAVNSVGEEEMVDGYMRDGVFTIDRVNRELIFRIGKKSAKAVRSVK